MGQVDSRHGSGS